MTNQDHIVADGNQMKLVFDFGVKSFIHAILLIDDFRDEFAWIYLDDEDKLSFLQNVSIYIGDDAEIASNNKLCPGGPFL